MGVVPGVIPGLRRRPGGKTHLVQCVRREWRSGSPPSLIAPGTLIAATMILGIVGLVRGLILGIRAFRRDPRRCITSGRVDTSTAVSMPILLDFNSQSGVKHTGLSEEQILSADCSTP